MRESEDERVLENITIVPFPPAAALIRRCSPSLGRAKSCLLWQNFRSGSKNAAPPSTGMTGSWTVAGWSACVTSSTTTTILKQTTRWNSYTAFRDNLHTLQHLRTSGTAPMLYNVQETEGWPVLPDEEVVTEDGDLVVRIPRRQPLQCTGFVEHGYTIGCPGCDLIANNRPGEAHHNETNGTTTAANRTPAGSE